MPMSSHRHGNVTAAGLFRLPGTISPAPAPAAAPARPARGGEVQPRQPVSKVHDGHPTPFKGCHSPARPGYSARTITGRGGRAVAATPAQVRAVIENYVKAWATGDKALILSLFAENAIWNDPVGTPPFIG